MDQPLMLTANSPCILSPPPHPPPTAPFFLPRVSLPRLRPRHRAPLERIHVQEGGLAQPVEEAVVYVGKRRSPDQVRIGSTQGREGHK